jgi:peptidoglycan/LPS O-acetylase OafA/YrhL
LSASRDHSKLAVLDGLRGGAAVYVMIGHAIWLLALPAGPRADRPWWGWVQVGLAFLFRYGHEVVMLFFVLSGLVIHLRLAQSRAAGKLQFDVKGYAWRRLTRLYPPLFASLIFTGVIDALGRKVNPALYSGAAPQINLNNVLNAGDSSGWTFLGNLLFLQNTFTPTFGTDGPLWSLAPEGFFYVIYPLVFVPIYLHLGPRWAFGLGWGGGLIGLWQWVFIGGGGRMVFLALWLLGAAIAEVVASGRRWRAASWVFGLGVICLPGLMIFYERFLPPIKDVLWGVAWATMILGFMAHTDSPAIGLVARTVERWRVFAPQSYTLYLFHFPALLFLSAVYLSAWGSLPAHFGLVAAGVVGSIALTAPLARWLENIGRRQAFR